MAWIGQGPVLLNETGCLACSGEIVSEGLLFHCIGVECLWL